MRLSPLWRHGHQALHQDINEDRLQRTQRLARVNRRCNEDPTLPISCPFRETDLLLTGSQIREESQRLTKIRKHSEYARSLSMGVSWDQMSVLRAINDQVDRICTAERSDQLLWGRVELEHPTEYGARRF